MCLARNEKANTSAGAEPIGSRTASVGENVLAPGWYRGTGAFTGGIVRSARPVTAWSKTIAK